MIADRRLYLTADRSRIVQEGDPLAAFLFVSPGQEYDHEEAERLGYKVQVIHEAKAMLEAPVNKSVEYPPEIKAGSVRGLIRRRKRHA